MRRHAPGEESTAAERVDYLIESLAFDNAKAFAKKVGVGESNISRWRNDKQGPSKRSLLSILRSYPEVREEWLMEGKGDPFTNMEVDPFESIQKRLDSLDRNVQQLMEIMRSIAEK